MTATIESKILLTIAGTVSFLLLLVSLIVISPNLFKNNNSVVVDSPSFMNENWQVKWPESHAHIDGLQTFVVTSTYPFNNSEFTVHWEVDNAIQNGVMEEKDGNYVAVTDVSAWDWKSSGQYNLKFKVLDTKHNIVSEKIIPVTAGAIFSTVTTKHDVVASNEIQIENTYPLTEDNLANFMFATNKQKTDINLEDNKVPANDISVISSVVEWVKGPVNQNQKFIIDTSQINTSEINVFWKSEGGHDNLVYKNSEGGFEILINVNGWRWKGKGPYNIIFTIKDKTSDTVLIEETLSMNWSDTPGESDISIVNQSVTKSSLLTFNSSAQPKTKADSNATIYETTINTTLEKTPSLSETTSMTFKSDSKSLLTITKPAVEASLNKTVDSNTTEAITYILKQPNSVWLNGDGHDSDVYINSILQTAKVNNKTPTFILYNIPHRDCGSYSSGGAKSASEYELWINRLAKLLTNEQAIVIIEPDALAQLNCAPAEARSERLQLISYAVTELKKSSNQLKIYIDAGHPYWVNSTEMAKRLMMAGIENATGFSLNISNYVTTGDNITYGNHLSNLTGGKRYVIDTSRNGNGPADNREWCNPSGRSLGQEPQLIYEHVALDAFLWIKFPGESDGYCNGGPSAGVWWMEYAVDLYHNKFRR